MLTKNNFFLGCFLPTFDPNAFEGYDPDTNTPRDPGIDSDWNKNTLMARREALLSNNGICHLSRSPGGPPQGQSSQWPKTTRQLDRHIDRIAGCGPLVGEKKGLYIEDNHGRLFLRCLKRLAGVELLSDFFGGAIVRGNKVLQLNGGDMIRIKLFFNAFLVFVLFRGIFGMKDRRND